MKGEALPKVLQAVTEFVAYVRENEAGTLAYSAWQDAADPVRFVHHIVFADAGAHQAHRSSRAVQRFTAVLYPEVQGQVEFREYTQVASTEPR
ncbi:MAG: antibiotic biosynthesis monooxygenase [Chloroflexi bacterium]|nr:antibiotic biosynthesis monooxygenase [Chloroflexota bacterium]